MIRKGLRRSRADASLSPDVARDPAESHVRPSGAPFLAQTLRRLFVSRGLGYRGVGFALSVATYRGWLPGVGTSNSEMTLWGYQEYGAARSLKSFVPVPLTPHSQV
jgi:hypothetical protein